MMKKLIIIASLSVFLPLAANAATLYITPSTGAYNTGEIFSMLINVNTAGKSINAASGQLNFDNSRLEVKSLGYSTSIFTLWTTEPTFSNAAGSVTFSGGLPSPGFTGPSGAILRITFKPKAQGQATVNFVSGSALANDGKGTNILTSFSGGIFNILTSSKAAPAEPKAAVPVSGVAVRPIEAPTITDVPQTLEAGQFLTIRGLTLPASKVLVTVEKGSEAPIIEETFSASDGRFSLTFSKPTQGGLYRVYARSVTADGLVTPQSETKTIEVVRPLFFRIGNVALNYTSIIVTLLSLLLFAVFTITYGWWKFRRWQKRQGAEISEAEEALHSSFDNIKTGFRRYIRHLADSKSPKSMKKKGEGAEEVLEEDLRDIEQEVKKEIEDIKHPKKHE